MVKMFQNLFWVSIPYRYDTTEQVFVPYGLCTIKFQFLIGTIRLAAQQKERSTILRQFQFLIGTIRRKKIVHLKMDKLVSIPYRYDTTEELENKGYTVSGSFNSL